MQLPTPKGISEMTPASPERISLDWTVLSICSLSWAAASDFSSFSSKGIATSLFRRRLYSHAVADFELHLASFLVNIHHDVIAMQNLSIENS
jgi:hypothetical protein